MCFLTCHTPLWLARWSRVTVNASEDEEFICECKVGNPRDTHTVDIKNSIAGECCTVGHIPRKISSVCSIP